MNFSGKRIAQVGKDLAALAVGVVVGNTAIGVIDDAAKPKDGKEPSAISTYAGPALVLVAGGAGAVALDGADQRYLRLMASGAAAAGAVRMVGRVLPASKDTDSQYMKIARGAFGEAAPSTSDYVPTFALQTSVFDTDTEALPAPGEFAALNARNEPAADGMGAIETGAYLY